MNSVRTEDWPGHAGAKQTNINDTPKETASLFRISALLLFGCLLSHLVPVECELDHEFL
jgi:hypothetical protein